jgi:hypothetical protein
MVTIRQALSSISLSVIISFVDVSGNEPTEVTTWQTPDSGTIFEDWDNLQSGPLNQPTNAGVGVSGNPTPLISDQYGTSSGHQSLAKVKPSSGLDHGLEESLWEIDDAITLTFAKPLQALGFDLIYTALGGSHADDLSHGPIEAVTGSEFIGFVSAEPFDTVTIQVVDNLADHASSSSAGLVTTTGTSTPLGYTLDTLRTLGVEAGSTAKSQSALAGPSSSPGNDLVARAMADPASIMDVPETESGLIMLAMLSLGGLLLPQKLTLQQHSTQRSG